MPFITACAISFVFSLLGGFILHVSGATTSPVLSGFIIGLSCILAIGVFNAVTGNLRRSAATGSQTAGQHQPASGGNKKRNSKRKSQSQSGSSKEPAKQDKGKQKKAQHEKPRHEKPGREKPRQEKPNSKPAKASASASPASGDLETGTVKWFNGNKGFGFIRRDNGEEIFVHFRSIEGDEEGGRRHLRDGQEVEFRVVDSDRGPQAENVRPL